MTRPNLPTTRDERIALAKRTIASLLTRDEQLDPQWRGEFKTPAIVTFTVLVPEAQDAEVLGDEVAEAIFGAGFDAVTYGAQPAADGFVCCFRVPVGAP